MPRRRRFVPGDPFAIFDDIDAMMEDNALMEASNRYESIMLMFFPERATLLGFESANTQLDTRTPARDQAALLALQSLQTAIKEMHGEKFSPAKRTDYALLKARVNYEIWQLNRNRLTTDPLYYTQAYDAVYDLLLKRLSLQTRQNEALSARSAALAQTAAEARQNLKAPSAFLAQLAMEKAYYAYLAYEQVSHRLQTQAQDDISRQDAVQKTNIARKNLKNMFEYFKALSQQEETPDFRLGEKDYLFVLQNKYFITDSPSALRKAAQRRLLEARKNLQEALEPFTVSADEEAEVITEDGSAFSAAKEVPNVNQDAISAGYGIAYLYGVLGVVLFVQIVPKILKIDMAKERESFVAANSVVIPEPKANLTQLEEFGFFPFFLAVAFGCIIGAIEIPKVNFSLGNSGGTLVAGLIIGHFGRIGKLDCRH